MKLTKAVIDKRSADGQQLEICLTIDAGKETKYPVCIEDCGPVAMLLRKEDVAWLREALYEAYYAVYGERP